MGMAEKGSAESGETLTLVFCSFHLRQWVDTFLNVRYETKSIHLSATQLLQTPDCRKPFISMTVSPPPSAGRFRWFVSARSLGTAVRVVVTAAVLFQLLLRGIALPEPMADGGQARPHVHLTGHPHHHHNHQRHHHGSRHDHADHRHGEHASHDRCQTAHGHCRDELATNEEDISRSLGVNCPTDHDTDAVYLDASVVIAPVAEPILLATDDALISWAEPTAAACSTNGVGCLQPSDLEGPPPNFRGLFPHRLQV